jgi:deazaflavin-dependent oxidoreductase (nitroreductase family)
MDVDRWMTRVNPVVAWLLRSPLHALLDAGLLLITVTGRRSGRRYTIPVGYQRDGDTLRVLVSKARRKQWWRNYRDPRPIEVLLRGDVRHGEARVVPPGSRAFRDVVDRTLQRLPSLGRQFGIAYDRRRGLTDDQWRTVAADAALVEIELRLDR